VINLRISRDFLSQGIVTLLAIIAVVALLFSGVAPEAWSATNSEGELPPISMEVELDQSTDDLQLNVRLTSNLKAPVKTSESFLPWGSWYSMVLIGVKDKIDGVVLNKKGQPIDDPSADSVTIKPGIPITGKISLSNRFDGLVEALDESDVIIFWCYRLWVDEDIPDTRAGGWLLIPKRQHKTEA